jgi:hypothetical protein
LNFGVKTLVGFAALMVDRGFAEYGSRI